MRFPRLPALRRRRVVVLPDVFTDVLVRLPPWPKARAAFDRIVRAGGGNLPVGPIEFVAGGNATNLGLTLARMGARVELIGQTDPLGLHLLAHAAKAYGLGIGHVRVGAAGSATVALEFEGANVMLSHAGSLRESGPDRLTPADWAAIEAADAVAVLNWSQNPRGTRLLKAVARRAHAAGAFVFLDTADPRHRPDGGRGLLRDAAIWKDVDAWGLNENELRAVSGRSHGDVGRLAVRLSKSVPCRLDVHTRMSAWTVHDGEAIEVPARRSPARRLTGAGDAWNAGNVAGYLLDMTPRQRLRLAHHVATAHVTA